MTSVVRFSIKQKVFINVAFVVTPSHIQGVFFLHLGTNRVFVRSVAGEKIGRKFKIDN